MKNITMAKQWRNKACFTNPMHTFVVSIIAIGTLSLLGCSGCARLSGGSGNDGNSGKTGNTDNGTQAFTMEQTISDGAQRTTLAFAGLALITGNIEAQSFFPPGKVAD